MFRLGRSNTVARRSRRIGVKDGGPDHPCSCPACLSQDGIVGLPVGSNGCYCKDGVFCCKLGCACGSILGTPVSIASVTRLVLMFPTAETSATIRVVHRKSLPNILTSSQNDFGRIGMCTPIFSIFESRLNGVLDTLDVPDALQRLKEIDMETFKLERACGMTPDPVNLSWPRKFMVAGGSESGEEREDANSEVAGDCFRSYVSAICAHNSYSLNT